MDRKANAKSTLTSLVWLGTLLHESSTILEELHWDLSQLFQTFSGHCSLCAFSLLFVPSCFSHGRSRSA
jgi:hypothetical protein